MKFTTATAQQSIRSDDWMMKKRKEEKKIIRNYVPGYPTRKKLNIEFDSSLA